MEVLYHKYRKFVVILLIICFFGVESHSDMKIVLKHYDTNLCVKIEKESHIKVPKFQSMFMKHCPWPNIPSEMKFSLHPIEPEDMVDINQSTPSSKNDQYILRNTGSVCMLTGSDNYSIKTGKCNTRHARYTLRIVSLEAMKHVRSGYMRSRPIQLESKSHHHHRNASQDTYAFLFSQGDYCLTAQLTAEKKKVAVMAPCSPQNQLQSWSICSTAGDCTRATHRFLDIPPPTGINTPTPSSEQASEQTISTTTEYVQHVTTASSPSAENTHNLPPVDPNSQGVTVESTECVKSEDSTCPTKSSSPAKLSKWAPIVSLLLAFITWLI